MLSFEESKRQVREAGIRTSTEFFKWCTGNFRGIQGRKPANIPSNPNVYYKDGGWEGWKNFLGTVA